MISGVLLPGRCSSDDHVGTPKANFVWSTTTGEPRGVSPRVSVSPRVADYVLAFEAIDGLISEVWYAGATTEDDIVETFTCNYCRGG